MMNVTISAVYEQGILRLSRPLSLPEHSQVRVNVLADDALADEFSFDQCLDNLQRMLDRLEQDWSNDLIRQLFPQLLRADLRVLWRLSQPSHRELCAMVELAATHLQPEELNAAQVSAIRFALDTMGEKTLTEDRLNQAHERLTASGLPPVFAFDEQMAQNYIDEL